MRRIWQVCVMGGVLAFVVFPTIGPSATGQQRFTRMTLPAPGSGTDFVCEVFLLPSGVAPASGSFGSLVVLFYSAPNCNGELVGSASVFSQGATDENASPTFLVSEAMLNTYFLMLQRAAGTGQQVKWLWCDDTKRSCIRALAVRGADATLR